MRHVPSVWHDRCSTRVLVAPAARRIRSITAIACASIARSFSLWLKRICATGIPSSAISSVRVSALASDGRHSPFMPIPALKE